MSAEGSRQPDFLRELIRVVRIEYDSGQGTGCARKEKRQKRAVLRRVVDAVGISRDSIGTDGGQLRGAELRGQGEAVQFVLPLAYARSKCVALAQAPQSCIDVRRSEYLGILEQCAEFYRQGGHGFPQGRKVSSVHLGFVGAVLSGHDVVDVAGVFA